MDDFKLTDEQLRWMADFIINNKTESATGKECFDLIDKELTRREELAEAVAFLDDDCLSCKL